MLGLPRTLSHIDSLSAFFDANRIKPFSASLDTIGIPKRITYLKEDGLFLNELQEQVTLEKLLWKEQYRQDAVSMYWVNQALEERINEMIIKNKRLEEDLRKAETEAITASVNMDHYKNLYQQEKSKSDTLNKQLKTARASTVVWKVTTGTFVATSLYLGAKLLFLN